VPLKTRSINGFGIIFPLIFFLSVDSCHSVELLSVFRFQMWWLYQKSNDTVDYRFVKADASKPVDEIVNETINTVNFNFQSLLSNNIL